VSWPGGVRVGDHVVARTRISAGWLSSVPAGARGIVRGRTGGLLAPSVRVEFERGFGTVLVEHVAERDLRRTRLRGDATWTFRRDVRAGVRLGLLILSAPALLVVVVYLLRGGDPVILVIDVVSMVFGQLVAFLSPVIEPLLVLSLVLLGVRLMVWPRRS
jgi:hypothetical protein